MKKKDYLKMAGAVALTAVLAVTGTFAYLNKITETKTNTFNSSNDIKTKIEETFENTKAENYKPGDLIHKQPTIKNEADSSDSIYVAVKLEYLDNEGNHVSNREFTTKYADILTNEASGISTDWKLIGNFMDGEDNSPASDFYFYKVPVEPNKSTTPVFTDTKVLTGITEVVDTQYASKTWYEVTGYDKDNHPIYEAIEHKEDTTSSQTLYIKNADGTYTETNIYKLPKFEIKVTGYAVQASGLNETTAISELKNLAGASNATK